MNRMVRRVNSYKKRVNRLIERKNTTRRWLEEEEKLHRRRELHMGEQERNEEHGTLLKLHLMPPIEKGGGRLTTSTQGMESPRLGSSPRMQSHQAYSDLVYTLAPGGGDARSREDAVL